MIRKTDKYIPALGLRALTHLYDPLLKWLMPESKFKQRLIDQARIQSKDRILDIGCGTGTLMILIKQLYPDTEVFGLDGDEKILQMTEKKAAEAGMRLNLNLGMAFELPYPNQSFHRIFSSLMIHHLTTANKELTFKEVYRVLVPGGEFHVADFGQPDNRAAYFISLFLRRLEQVSDNIKGLLPPMLGSAGFEQIEETERFMTIFGTLVLLSAKKPEKDCP